MKFVFYITNHGFGHASRNVPIIKKLLEMDSKNIVYVKSDKVRCDFLKKNLISYSNVNYVDNCYENGVILKQGQLSIDIEKTKEKIINDLFEWDNYIKREQVFLSEVNPDVVISDIIPWAIKSANICGIKTVLIGSFTWVEMYWDYFGEEIWKPYLECYKLADKILWYEIHSDDLHSIFKDYECISLVSREPDINEVNNILSLHKQPIVFVSLGGSANLSVPINVEGVPYDFVATRGVNLIGSNVYNLPTDMINTPDYIAASKIVIAKGGWSTVAEILLQKKKCGLLFRGDNSEDRKTKKFLLDRNQCVDVTNDDLKNMDKLINRIEELKPSSYDIYRNDVNRICDIICLD